MKNQPLALSNTVVACSQGFIEAEVDGEILALSVEQGTCYGMNAIGSRIWAIIAKPIQVSNLCAALLAAYKVDPEVCERQLLDLLEKLRAEGLIRIIEEQ